MLTLEDTVSTKNSLKQSGVTIFRLSQLMTEQRDKQIDEILEILTIESDKQE